MTRIILSMAIVLLTILPRAYSNELTDGWKLNGYVQTIPYLDGRDFSNKTYMPIYTSMKLRLGVEKSVGDYLDFNVQFQNSRVFGQEGAITNNNSHIFMIQGYLEFKNILNQPLSLKVGRYQSDYGTGRFISVSPWNYVERAFDGFKLKYDNNDLMLEAFYAKHTSETKSQNGNAFPTANIFKQTEYNDYDMAGLFGEKKLSEDMKIQALGYMELDNAKNAEGVKMLERFTGTVSFLKSAKPLGVTVELGYQGGKNQGRNIAAYLTSVKLDYKISDFTLTIANDKHSGTAPNSGEVNTFNNYPAAKHRFFGLMDYFTTASSNYPLGVDDYYAGFAWKFAQDWNMTLFGHQFISNKEALNYGSEIDLTIRYNLDKKIFVEFGNGIFLPDDLMIDMFESSLGPEHSDPALVTYLRFTARL